MTKQEKIRKGLIKFFTPPNTTFKGNPTLEANITQVIDSLIEHLHSQGVVIKADRELPKEEWSRIGKKLSRKFSFNRIDWLREPEHTSCLTELAKETEFELGEAGYVAVEPLIEEVT